MKAEVKKPRLNFTPVSMEITFESQDELDAFGAIFNVCAITDAAEEQGSALDHTAIRETIRELGGDCNRLHRGIVAYLAKHFNGRRA